MQVRRSDFNYMSHTRVSLALRGQNIYVVTISSPNLPLGRPRMDRHPVDNLMWELVQPPIC